MTNMKKYSSVVLRAGIAVVFLWFGFSQLKNPSMWIRMLPDFLQSSGNTFVYVNGIFEITFATLLLLGLYTRFVSLILGLHLLSITFFVVDGPTGARDFGLSLATLAIFLIGADEFCLDKILKERKKKKEVGEEEISSHKNL